MNDVKFKLDINGLRELMKSSEMQSVLQQAGNSVAARGTAMSGGKYSARVHTASYTAIANIYPDSDKARRDNWDKNTALKALQGGGL